MLFFTILQAELERSEAGDFLEKAIESLVGAKAAHSDGIDYGIMVGGIVRVAKEGLRMLHTVTRDVLRETESRPAVDTIGYIGTVAAYGIRQVLDGQMRIGKQLVFPQHGRDLIE